MASLRSGISSQTHLKSESRNYSEDHDTRDASSSTFLNTVHFRTQRENVLVTQVTVGKRREEPPRGNAVKFTVRL